MFSPDNFTTKGRSSLHNDKGSAFIARLGSRRLPSYPLVIACLGLLNAILLLAAVVIGIYCGNVSEMPAPHHITAQALIEEVKQLQIMKAEAIKAHEKAQQQLKEELSRHEQLQLQAEQNKSLSDDFQRQLEALQVERATIKSETSVIWDSCGLCQPGWFLLNTTCYFHSKNNPTKTWLASKEDCISRGANLTVIESLEEQVDLFEYLPKLDSSIRPWWSRGGGVWIGLTDIQSEGNWVWLNNVTLQDGRYWIPGEPNNFRMMEHCAAVINIKNPRATWFDASCEEKKEWLCEKKLSSL
ncbi:uncharacterized protein V6R79_005509 [Siganus canaliculatus]